MILYANSTSESSITDIIFYGIIVIMLLLVLLLVYVMNRPERIEYIEVDDEELEDASNRYPNQENYRTAPDESDDKIKSDSSFHDNNKPDASHDVLRTQENQTDHEVHLLPPGIEMNDDFASALNLIHKNCRSAFITGRAGTGKSTFLKYFHSINNGATVLLAPTGIAAINIGGQTIHSFFQFKPRLIDKKDIRAPRTARLIKQLKTIVIDEASMVRADVMDGIDHALRLCRNSNLPFGGVQIVLFGDLFQLPPVVKENELKRYFAQNYGSSYFFDAHVFNSKDMPCVEFEKVYRQKEVQFLDALNCIREKISLDHALPILNARVCTDMNRSTDESEVTLTTTNARADNINQQYLKQNKNKVQSYQAVITGRWKDDQYPTEKSLRLKKGVKVMILRNDPNRRWVNGTIGIIRELRSNSALVQVGNNSYEINAERWENIEYDYEEKSHKVVPRVVGVFEQLPLKIAYAITIHKSQGQTFDNVCIDLDKGAFSHGQLYVALSRCRTLNGLRLIKSITIADVIVDEEAKRYRSRFIRHSRLVQPRFRVM